MKTSVTLACADPINIKESIDILDKVGVEYYHIDIMDGMFVPNFCMNIDQIARIVGYSKTPLDVHLMITNPMNYLDRINIDGVEIITTHLDVECTMDTFISKVKGMGKKIGIALSPEEECSKLYKFLPYIDLVLVMGVKPGFSGQTFIDNTLNKIKALSQYRKDNSLNYCIEVDGGINFENGIECVNMGADILVAGALAIFKKGECLEQLTKRFKEIV